MIRVLVCDDHAVVRAGLCQLIATFADVSVAGSAGGGDEALAILEGEEVDIVLMDLEMPGMDGITATRLVRERHPAAAVVILTSFSDRARILRALDAGAIGYLLKDATPEELERGIRSAARGEAPLDPRAASALLTARSRSAPVAELSPRELEILELVAHGLPNKLIARRLGISEKTVKAHLTSIFRAIDARDRTQAALWAVRNGIVDSPRAGEGREQ